MALTLQASVFTKQRVQAFPGLSARLTILVNDFLSLLVTQCGDPLLQFCPFALPAGAVSPDDDVTLVSDPCRVFALVVFNASRPDPIGTENSFEINGAGPSTFFQASGAVNGEGVFEQAQFFPSGIPFEAAEVPLVAAGQDSESALSGFLIVGAAG